jgi:hypothetical protein
MKKDILVHYKVTKQADYSQQVNTELLISCIYTYIQNTPIYFKYEPNFVNSILVFGIIGFKREHMKLQKRLGSDIEKLGCSLSIISKQGEDKNENALGQTQR